jgi:hypothetical protein
LRAARRTATEALPLAWQTGIVHYFLDHLALYAARTGQAAQAAQFVAFADKVYAAIQEPRQPNEARSVEQTKVAIASTLDAQEYARLRAAGEALSETHAEALARAVLVEQPE